MRRYCMGIFSFSSNILTKMSHPECEEKNIDTIYLNRFYLLFISVPVYTEKGWEPDTWTVTHNKLFFFNI